MTEDRPVLPPETSVGRVALRVADLDRVVDFYNSVVGLAVRDRDDSRAVLGAGGTDLLAIHHAPELPAREEAAAGLFHTAVRVPTRSALAEALRRIENRWRLTGASDHLVSEALYLRDPEGNGVEVYHDTPREEWPTSDGRVGIDTLPLDLDALREDGAVTETVPDETDVGHVHLEVTSLPEARAFYVDTLGMSVRSAMDRALFVAAGDYHHHVGLNTWNGRSRPAAGRGLWWFELRVPDDALPNLRERLAAASAVESTDDGFEVADPDGIRLRLVGV